MDPLFLTRAYFCLCYCYYFSVTAGFCELAVLTYAAEELQKANSSEHGARSGCPCCPPVLVLQVWVSAADLKCFRDCFVWVSSCDLWYTGENLRAFKDDLFSVFLL